MGIMISDKKVYVAMSGGVDSAIAAAKLLKAGFRVTGIHMETWKDPQWQSQVNTDSSSSQLAKHTAAVLGIPFVSLDIRTLFYEKIVKAFIRDYLRGQTPNPCLFCNPHVKWGVLQSYALEKGADFFATGHYARIEAMGTGGTRLLRAIDKTKDQSYVLSMLSQSQLIRSLLPLGEMSKNDVRLQARHLNLPVADRQDSQDLCFLGSGDYRDFLQRFAPNSSKKGDIVDAKGNIVGQHHGLAFYTIGQRKGIRIASKEPYYVLAKDNDNNRLIIGYANQVIQTILTARHANWVSGEPPVRNEIYDVMIRYRAKPVSAFLSDVTEHDFRLKFLNPLRGITPGQVAVIYQGEQCLGGGVIQTSC